MNFPKGWWILSYEVKFQQVYEFNQCRFEFPQVPTLYKPLPLGGTVIAGLLGLAVLLVATPARVLDTPEPRLCRKTVGKDT